MFNVIKRYIKANLIVFAFAIYIFFSAVFYIFTGIDICIPCIWKKIFGITCPGCGLTTAFISLLKFDFKGAYEANRLIFILIPFALYYLITDFKKFKYNTIINN